MIQTKCLNRIVDEDISLDVVGNVAGTGGESVQPELQPKQMKKYKKKNKDGTLRRLS